MYCYIDMDGVLVDFVNGALKRHHMQMQNDVIVENGGNFFHWPAGIWDIHTVLAITEDQFWEPLQGSRFWENLDWMPDGKQILDIVVSRFGRDNVCLLSTPNRDPECLMGKQRWVMQHLPEMYRQVIYTPKKHMIAHPGALLIDDRDENIALFRKAGGKAILLPRHWNSLYCSETIYVLERMLERI